MDTKLLDNIIAELGHILLTDDVEAFERMTEEKFNNINLDANGLKYLKDKLHNPPAHLKETPVDKLGLGQWMAICQHVIFELLYNKKVKHLAFIKGIAFGEYDWTQATALEVLTRLIVDEVLDTEMIDEINGKIGEMRYETHLYYARALKQRGSTDNRYLDFLRKIGDSDFQEALRELD